MQKEHTQAAGVRRAAADVAAPRDVFTRRESRRRASKRGPRGIDRRGARAVVARGRQVGHWASSDQPYIGPKETELGQLGITFTTRGGGAAAARQSSLGCGAGSAAQRASGVHVCAAASERRAAVERAASWRPRPSGAAAAGGAPLAQTRTVAVPPRV